MTQVHVLGNVWTWPALSWNAGLEYLSLNLYISLYVVNKGVQELSKEVAYTAALLVHVPAAKMYECINFVMCNSTL